MAIPIGALIWTALGTAAAVRALWNPHRSVMADAAADRCPADKGCEPALVLDSYGAAQPVRAMTTGIVTAITGPVVAIASEVEPIVLRYEADLAAGGMQMQVQAGQRVRIGQQIGLAKRLAFSVLRAERVGGTLTWVPLEPASWLATRGLGLSTAKHEGQRWCERGRKLVVPEQVAKCGMKLPAPTGYMLLPVSVTLG